MTNKGIMPPPAHKPKKKEPEIQIKFEKPPPMVVQKTLLRRTPTWKLQKHKQYFQNAAAWLYIFSIFFPVKAFPQDIFLSIFSSLSQGSTRSTPFCRDVGILFAKISLTIYCKIIQNWPKALEEA